ncbi:MAG: LTA synthase family protein [Acutalibacter sp.]
MTESTVLSKLKEWRAKLAWASLPLCFLGLFLFDAALRYFYRFAGSTRFLDWRALVFTGAWSLLLTAVAALVPPLVRRILMGVYALFFALLTVLNGVMFNIFGEFFSFSDMNFAGDGAKFFSWSYLNLRKALVACILLAILCLALGAVLVPKHVPGKRRWPLRVGAGVAAVASVVCVLLLHQSLLPKSDTLWWGTTYDPGSESESYKEFTDSNRNLMITGLYQYTVRDFLVSFGLEGSPIQLGELDQFYEERAQQVGVENEMTGRFQGKNLILVMLESVDTWLITPEYMPNLYQLQQEGTDFVNHYTPLFLSAGTFNTEFISLTSLLPSVTGLSSSVYITNSFPEALPQLFAQEGYASNSFHPANPSIYNRGSIHENLGMTYHSGYDMGMENYMLDSDMMADFDEIVPEGNFFSYIITYSGHGPYTEEMSEISDPHLEAARAAVAQSGVTGSDANMEEYTLAVAHAMETDQFIGELVDRLEEEGRLDDTVLWFYTDHYGKYMTDKTFLKEIKGVEGDSPELYRTPCFYYAKGEEPQKVEKYVSSADIAPTIANLFGLPADFQYYMGDDIFGDQGGIVCFPNSNWYDGETYYTSDYTGEVTQEMREISARVNAQEQASFNTLKSDYFAKRGIS